MKTDRLEIKLTPKQKKEIKEKAESLNISVSAYIRMKLSEK